MPKKPKRKPAKKRKPRPLKPDANQIAFRVLQEATQGKYKG
jgi:hypothetical protein